MILTLLLGGLALLIWWIFQPKARIKKLGDLIPGPAGYPLVGNMFSEQLTGVKSIKCHNELGLKYDGVYKLWMGPELLVIVGATEDIEAVLTNNELLEKSYPYKFLHSWLGSGLLTSTGQKWHMRRKAITPAFHFKILEQFVSTFNSGGAQLIKILEKEANKDFVDIENYMKGCTLGIICETAMGTKLNGDEFKDYISSVQKMIYLLANRIDQFFLHSDFTYALTGGLSAERKLRETLDLLTQELIKEKKQQQAEFDQNTEKDSDDLGIKKKTAFLELLLNIKKENKAVISDDADIREEVNTFLFAGHDTTTAAMCYSLQLLARNPDIQEKVYQELAEQFEPDSDFTYENLTQMKYLERVIKECFRMHSSVPMIGRRVTKEITLPKSGYTLPVDSTVIINIHFNHVNPKNYPNPEVFNPDNFLPEEIAKRHPFSFIPFSAGPRNCIGQKFAMLELKTVLAKMILNYKLSPVKDWDVIPEPRMVLHSASGHRLKITKRTR